jgi:hypothetical protein
MTEDHRGSDWENSDVTPCGLVGQINDILMVEATESSKTSLHVYRTTRRHIPEDSNTSIKFSKSG